MYENTRLVLILTPWCGVKTHDETQLDAENSYVHIIITSVSYGPIDQLLVLFIIQLSSLNYKDYKICQIRSYSHELICILTKIIQLV